MDREVGQQKYEMAKAQVALEDAEASLGRNRQQCQSLLNDMARLRDMDGTTKSVAVRTSCGSVSYRSVQVSDNDVKQALARKLATYKAKSKAVDAEESAVEKHRMAWQTLATRYENWNQERMLLAHRLQELRARHKAQQVGTTTAGSIDTTNLARASQLADEIERKLRIAETQDALGTSPVEQLLSGAATDLSTVESEVDELLGRTSGVATTE